MDATNSPCTGPDWMGYPWTAWMPLMAAHPLGLAQLPSQSGLYRLRRTGGGGRLVWAGWAGRGVREVVERLSRQVHLPVEPYDDPLSPARELLLLRRREGASFEVAGTPLEMDEFEGSARGKVLLRACLAGQTSEESEPL